MADWYQGALGYYVYRYNSNFFTNKKEKLERQKDEKKTQQTIRIYQKYIDHKIKMLRNKNIGKAIELQKVFDNMSENKLHQNLWTKMSSNQKIKDAFIQGIRKNIGFKSISVKDLERLINFDETTQTILAKEQEDAENMFSQIKVKKIQTGMKQKIQQGNKIAQTESTEIPYTHIYLTTLVRRAEELRKAINELANDETTEVRKELQAQINNLINIIEQLVNSKKVDYKYLSSIKTNKIRLNLDNEFQYNDNGVTKIKISEIVQKINFIAKAVEADIIKKINAAISEIVGSFAARNIRGMAQKILIKNLTQGVTGNAGVNSQLERAKIVFPKEAYEEAKTIVGKHKIRKSLIANDQYRFTFGQNNAQNKIDFFLRIDINESKQSFPISYKRYAIDNQRPVHIAESTSLLGYIGAIQNKFEQNNIGTEIINALTFDSEDSNVTRLDTRTKELTLTTLRKQIIYAALTGELGSRMLLGGNKKAEFLVIENANTPSKKKVYSIGELLDNLEMFYMSPKINDLPQAFEQRWYGEKEDSRLNSFIRITKILAHLRQQEIEVSLNSRAVIF